MILKGSQRSHGGNLAAHLLNTRDNEHVELHELRGFACDDLHGAFKEVEAISRGTRCSQYLFSLSLNPPQDACPTTADFESAIQTVEERLGLTDQPRAIVFHEKEGRRHAHCVWSRIDAETMSARPLSFFKNKLAEVSRGLYLDHGWQMPEGIRDAGKRDPTNFTLAEWQQAKRHGLDPRALKSSVQEAWAQSDNGAALSRALEARGFHLAKGDKRGFVVLDFTGEVHSLPKMLGLKTKEVRARLGDGAALPGVAESQRRLADKMKPALRRHIEDSRTRFRARSNRLGERKAAMTGEHREARKNFDARIDAEWIAGCRARAARLPKGLRGLWHRITGEYRKLRAALEEEAARTRARHDRERAALIEKQHRQRAALQEAFTALRRDQAKQLLTLRSDIGRFFKLSHSRDASADRAASRARSPSTGLKLSR